MEKEGIFLFILSGFLIKGGGGEGGGGRELHNSPPSPGSIGSLEKAKESEEERRGNR